MFIQTKLWYKTGLYLLTIIFALLFTQSCTEVWVLPTDPPGSGDSVQVSILDTVTIHTPDSEHKNLYPRVVELPNGNLIASFTERPVEGFEHHSAKIYRSTNGGVDWTWIADLTDTHREQAIYDPELFVMPTTMGIVPEGTLIAAVRSAFWVSTSYIDMYRSDDGGETWSFMSNVAAGTGFGSNIYEPFLMVDTSGRLLCYYADERDSTNHSQKLVYQASIDGGYNWDPPVDVVALPDQSARPGMPQVTKMGNDEFMLVYEYAWHPTPGIVSPIHYKISSDGYSWGSVTDPGTMITAEDGTIPGVSPTVTWTPTGSSEGTVIVTAGRNNPVSSRGSDNFINYNYGSGPWYRIQQPLAYTHGNASAGYSRSVTPSSDGGLLYHINGVDFTSTNAKAVFSTTLAAFTRGYIYKIVNKDSRLVLSIQGGSTADGAKATQEDDNYTDDQKWAILDADEGGPQDYVKIVNKKSKKVLDILNGSTADGADAIQWPSSTATSQLWEVIPTGDGLHQLKNVNSGKLLGVTDCSSSAGALVDQWSDNGTDCQEWQLQVIE